MRIIGYLETPGMKTTVFKMDNRLSVKFETGHYEQTYKFRSGEGIDTLEDVQALIGEAFVREVARLFREMHKTRIHASTPEQIKTGDSDDFEEIL
ncbi:MAG: hypothetical protein IPN74_03775 [Haliscomenobacter sp.]|nr:hypothetical protein [Haliscomenobacter sp.]